MAGIVQKQKEREFLVECIHLYRDMPTLWNTKSKEYYDRIKKKAAYETLLSKYKKMFTEATKDDLKKKLNSLRTNYRKELRKHLQRKLVSSTGDTYQPTLWYYDEMVFLQDLECASDPFSSMDTDTAIRRQKDTKHFITQDSTITGNDRPSTKPAVFEPESKKPKNKQDKRLILATKRFRRSPDEYLNWALSCAADLKKMEPLQQIFAKKAIGDIIMEGQLGLLHRNSVKINAQTTL